MHAPPQTNAILAASILIVSSVGAGAFPAEWFGQKDQKSIDSPKLSQPSEIYLSSSRSFVLIPVRPADLTGPSPHLSITVLRIKNPDNVAFSLLVALEPQVSSAEGNSSKTDNTCAPSSSSILLGDLGVYPSDQPGRYQLDISSQLERLRNSGQDLARLCLKLALKQLHPEQPAKRLEIFVGSPAWKHGASSAEQKQS